MAGILRRAMSAAAVSAVLLAVTAPHGPAAAQSQPTGMVLITVGGAIAESNRPPATEDDQTFLGHLDIAFEKGMAFDRGMLETLGMSEIVVTPPHESRAVTFAGPRLAAILEAAGASGEVVMVTALDGYAAEVTMEEVAIHEPILAIQRDGVPLGLGGRGPGRLVFTPTDDPEIGKRLRSDLAVWAVIYIGVQ